MRWLSRLFRRSEQDAQLDSELRFHVEQQTADNIAAGMNPDEARRRALAQFGGLEYIKEETRDARGTQFVESLVQDIRFALRMLRKSPGFTLVAVLTLALGIGANTAIFSVVDAVVLRPLPFNDSQRVVTVWWGIPSRDLPNGTGTLEVAADYASGRLNISGSGTPQRIAGAEVSQSWFRVFGLHPLLGRTFSTTDEQPGHVPVMILSHELWQSGYQADPHIVGRTISLDGKAFTAIGVLPAGFDFPDGAQAWLPMPAKLEDTEFGGNTFITFEVARIRPGATLDEARAELAVIQKREAGAARQLEAPRVETLHQFLVGDTSQAALLLFGAVGFILLIACADVANLLLARGAGRAREVAVRCTLGATRWRLIRQFLSESILLSILGGGAGVLCGCWAIKAARTLIPVPTAFAARVSLNGPVLAFTCALAIATGIIAGIFPALQASGSELSEALKEGARSSPEGFRLGWHRAMRHLFGIAEIALALILAVGATLFLRSLSCLLDVNPGFRTDNVLVAHFSLLGPKYTSGYRRAAFWRAVRERVQTMPGVRQAAFVNVLPLGADMISGMNITLADGTKPVLPNGLPAVYMIVTPKYFQTMSVPLLAGRDFTDADLPACQSNNSGRTAAHPRKKAEQKTDRRPRDDSSGNPYNSRKPNQEGCSTSARNIAILSESLANAAWPGRSAVGQHFWLFSTSDPPIEVVGVVGDVRIGLADEPWPMMYFPAAQSTPNDASLVVHTTANPLALVSGVRRAVRDVDPDEPISSFTTMDYLLSHSVARPRFRTFLLAIFGALALVLACVGVYGVISYTVAQRAHEIGVRVALGASRPDVLRIVALYVLRLAAIGLGAGLLGALLLVRLAASFLFGVRSSDPLSFALGCASIVCVILLASYVPARRATKVDPIVALRYE
jgi:putative ABC transport system permease protein